MNQVADMNWPPDYRAEAIRRGKLLEAFSSLDDPRKYFKDAYGADAEGCIAFIQDWCWTVDTRIGKQRKESKKPIVNKPFILFEKQKEQVRWVISCIEDEENGLIEKTRGAGCTWTNCAISVWLWLCWDDVSIGWGSRKEQLVDRKGDMDSIFGKLRFLIDKLPWFAKPEWLIPKVHLTFMKCENADNGSFIKGEAGDNIGRGGRSLVYFKDESAHYERADLIEAALSENTPCQIDFSSVNGVGNVFHQNRFGGVVRLFIFDHTDVPWMDEAFLDKKRAELEAKGLGFKFKQEYERDYAASVEGIIIPGEWVRASIDAHIKLNINPGIKKIGGLDVADEGGDTNAYAQRTGILLDHLSEWAEGDTDYTTHEAIRLCLENGGDTFIFDAVGVGAGVKAEAKKSANIIKAIPFKGSWKVAFPNDEFVKGVSNADMFRNMKAQSWWQMRMRFYRTFKAVTKGEEFDPSELISLSSKLPLLQRLVAELSQPTRTLDEAGRIKVNKKPEGSKSPNLADSVDMAYSDNLIKSKPLVW